MPDPLFIQEQIDIACSLAEGQFREFKSGYAGPPAEKVKREVKSICRDIAEGLVAFANADGGELIIGVEDDGTITGIDKFAPEEIEILKAAPKTHVHKNTPLQSVLVYYTIVHDKAVLYFRIAKGTKQIHLTSDGRCLRRNDLETIPVPAEEIQFERRETISREYDRDFIDGASVADLDRSLLQVVSSQISTGISIEKCLQYLGLAEYDSQTGLRIRRAALLLFGNKIDDWHPRVQVRIMKVNGTEVGAGPNYNISGDETIRRNIFVLIDEAWEKLRPYLVVTKFQDDARFKTTYIYPEIACREALINAVAHRDYSEEGRGIEIFIFDDRIEIKNPGGLLSSISIYDIKELKGAHQSRNSYIARALREAGIMRELGEGMRRIFELMKSNELAPPELISNNISFSLLLHHRPMYARDEIVWLEQFDSLNLSSEQKSVILMGRKGDLIAPNDIIRKLGIVDIEHYRQVVNSLQKKLIFLTAVNKSSAQSLAKKKGVGIRDVPRFAVKVPGTQPTTRPTDRRGRIPSVDIGDIDTKMLYVANIPHNTNERDIIEAFRKVGEISSVIIPRTGSRNRGYAFIQFQKEEDAKAAMDAETFLGGRRLVIRWKEPKKQFAGRF